MSFQAWIQGMVIASVICGAAMFLMQENASKNALRLICGLIMTAVVVMPLAQGLKKTDEYLDRLFINFDFDNIVKAEGIDLSETLIQMTAEERLSGLLYGELARRLGREDFSVEIRSEGTAKLRFDSDTDFPAEEAKLILSALLGGCEVQLDGGWNQ